MMAGTLVICINAEIICKCCYTMPLVKGKVYTIAASIGNQVLVEEVSPPGGHSTFYAHRFRPVKKQALDIFYKIEQEDLVE